MKPTKRLLAGLTCGSVALFAVSTTLADPPAEKTKAQEQPQQQPQPQQPEKAKPAQPQQEKPKYDDKAKQEGDNKMKDAAAEIGKPAPAFTLTDTDGKEHKLADLLKDGKTIVVLEWFNPQCPFVKKHHETLTTMTDTYAKYKEQGVVWLAINSGGPGKDGAGQERNAKARTDWKVPFPVLLDESGTVGKTYGARTTPHMFVIAKDGTLAYTGAIDDNPSADGQGSINYVAKALDELIAGTNVTKSETRPYGCSVKYGSAKN